MSHITNIPGLPGGPLETSFPIHVALVSPTLTRNRPGIKLRGFQDTIQHNTANWNTLAPAEANYLRNGAGGRQASWHFTADDSIVEMTIPVDEVAWQAGDGSGPGNMSCVACELTQLRAMVENATRWRRARSNAAEILGKVAARKGSPPPGKFHQDYSSYQKYCPALLLGNATWMSEYHDDYKKFYEMEKKAMAGGGTTEPPAQVIEIGDTIKALVRLNVRQATNTASPVLTTLDIGTEMVVTGRWSSGDGYGWLPVKIGDATGYVAQGNANGPFIELVSKPVPPTETYVKAVPIPALLETDLNKYDTAEGIVTDDTGNEFIFVADVVEFTKETVAGQYAVEDPKPVKAPYKARERAIAAWLVEAKEGSWYYILAGEGDEWIRVPYANTIRVSDAPLLGDETT